MADLALYVAAALVLLLGLHRFVAARRGAITASMRYAYGFAYFMSAALATLAPSTITAAARTTYFIGLPGLPGLLGDSLRCCAAGELGLLALTLDGRSQTCRAIPALHTVRGRAVAAVAVLAAAVSLYLAAAIRPSAGELLAPGPHRWFLAGYDALLTGYVACCLWTLTTRLAARTRCAAPGPHRTGLRLITWSAALGLLWTAWGLDDVIVAARTGLQSGGEDALSALLGMACVGLLVAGASSALWGRVSTALADWTADYRRFRALTPLWAALHTAFPEIVLLPGARLLPPLDIRFALYRRVIEIHDARLLLQRHLDAAGASQVREAFRRGSGRPGRTDATVEAALMATALRQVARDSRPSGRAGGDWEQPEASHGELDSAADWLDQVAHAFAHSADVARIRRK